VAKAKSGRARSSTAKAVAPQPAPPDTDVMPEPSVDPAREVVPDPPTEVLSAATEEVVPEAEPPTDVLPTITEEVLPEPPPEVLPEPPIPLVPEPPAAPPPPIEVVPESHVTPFVQVDPGSASFAPDAVPPPVAAAPPPPPARTLEPARRRRGLIAAIVVLVIALLLGGTAAAALYFFQSHVRPGVELMGHNLTGLTQAEVADEVAALANDYRATLTLGETTEEATAADLGVTFDQAATVAAVMNPPSTGTWFDQYSPWVPKPVSLALSVDRDTLRTYLNDRFIGAAQRQVPAGVTYDQARALFSVVPAVVGVQADPDTTAAALETCAGMLSPLEISTMPEAPAITDTTAQAVVDQANRTVAAPLVLSAGKKKLTIPPATVGTWLTFASDPAAGTITMGYKPDQIAVDVPPLVQDSLAVAPVAEEIIYSPGGARLGMQTKGVDGTAIADPNAVVAQVVAAVEAGTGLHADVKTVPQAYPSHRVPMAAEYLKPDGEKWVEVNLTTFTVTAWNGTTLFGSSKVVTGASGGGRTPTRPGMFHVYYKVPLQDMDGLNPDGTKWEVKDVPWIAYFDGGIALHGAYWRSSFGYADSHGCVNMPVSFAKQVYDWVKIGTLVVVHT